jgi:aminobenzoyl-glutamate transport protein
LQASILCSLTRFCPGDNGLSSRTSFGYNERHPGSRYMDQENIRTDVQPRTRMQRALDRLEVIGNKLPDPAMIFVIALVIVWAVSVALARVDFADADPRTVKRDATGQVISSEPIRVKNMLLPEAVTGFVARMVKTFVEFPPLGLVLRPLLRCRCK